MPWPAALLVRANVGLAVGTGHAMRCLALAEGWIDRGGRAAFALGCGAPAVADRLTAEGIAVHRLEVAPGSDRDAETTYELATALGAEWVAVDGYGFAAAFQRTARRSHKLLVIDDDGAGAPYTADLVLNQNLSAHRDWYRRRPIETRLLVGTRYALLRREFRAWRTWRRETPDVARRLLVTLGGTDPANGTLAVLRALAASTDQAVATTVVLGGDNPHLSELEAAAAAIDAPVSFRRAADMPSVMSEADMAVSAAGTTCWELAFMGLPALLVSGADNQRPNASALAVAGAARDLGPVGELRPSAVAEALADLARDAPMRERMSDRGRQIVDGEGVWHVIDAMRQLGAVRLRPATDADRSQLLAWANDPLTRRMSFHGHTIDEQEHERWFARLMSSARDMMVVIEAHSDHAWQPVGQVRIDGDGVVSVSIAPEHRGRGFAVPALVAAVSEHRRRFGARRLTAFIKPENTASIRSFEQVGFELAGSARIAGQDSLEYVLGPVALALEAGPTPGPNGEREPSTGR